MESAEVIGAFSDEQAARITGVSVNQLRAWDQTGFFRSSFGTDQPHIPYGRLYSFRDLVSLQVLHDLRNEKRIPLQHLKEVSKKLSHLGDARWTAVTLYVLGKRVVFDDPSSNERLEVVSRQRVFNIPLRIVVRDTRSKIAALNKRSDNVGRFERNRFVSQNEQVFSGTRIPISTVVGFLNAGYSSQDVVREFPGLTMQDVEAAATHAGEHAA